jgi:hypothetical protein
MTPVFAHELKNLGAKHQVPIMVNVAVDPKTGIVQLVDFGLGMANKLKAERVKKSIEAMFRSTGIVELRRSERREP